MSSFTLEQVVSQNSVTNPSGKASLVEYDQILIDSLLQGSGFSLGNLGGWTVGKNIHSVMDVATRGIHQSLSIEMNKHAAGDSATIYAYNNSDGGISACSDEGVTVATLEQNEPSNYFHGTVAATSGLGDTKPSLLFVNGNNWTSDNAFLLNISKGTLKGNIIGQSIAFTPVAGGMSLGSLPITGTMLPISTACGYCSVAIPNTGMTMDSPVSYTMTVELIAINGVKQSFEVGSHVVIAGSNFVEQSFITNVVDQGNGMQTLTMKLRYPNTSAFIFQEGIAGQFISFGANLRFSGMRSSYYAIGSTTGTDLIYAVNVGGDTQTGTTLPQINNEAATNDGGPNSDFELFPGAEIVSNATQIHNCTLEQNNVNWQSLDEVENPHYPIGGGCALWVTKSQTTPTNGSHGSSMFQLTASGPGFGGGNCYMRGTWLDNPANYYQGNGGPLLAPIVDIIEGTFSCFNFITTSHEPGGAVTKIMAPNNPNNPNAPVMLACIDYDEMGNLIFTPQQGWMMTGPLNTAGYLVNGKQGFTGTLSLANGETVSVQGGLIIGVE